MESIVAAYNSDPQFKETADYVCDGVADEVEIQAALTRFNSVQLIEGTYHLTKTLEVAEPPKEK